jgi:hypothetical protein
MMLLLMKSSTMMTKKQNENSLPQNACDEHDDLWTNARYCLDWQWSCKALGTHAEEE